MPKIMVNGTNLHYWQFGTGPDVVLLHGLGGNLAVWHLTIVPELQRQYRVTTYDLRGHGYSDMPQAGYTTQEMAADLRGLMDALGIEQAHMVGHSWGADIALHFALLHPRKVAKMVVIEAGLVAALSSWYQATDWEGWIYWAKMIEKATGVTIPPEKQCDLEYMFRQLITVPIMYGPARGRRRSEEVVVQTLNMLKSIWYGPVKEGNLTVGHLARILQPTLLIYETGSPYLKSHEILRAHLADYTSVLLPETEIKHFSPLEQPALLVEHIGAFLQPARIQATAVRG